MMNHELYNLDQLREEVSSEILEYQKQVKNSSTSQETLISIIESLITERECLIDEIDNNKEVFQRWFPLMFRKDASFKLVLDNFDDMTLNDLNILAHKLERSTGEILSILMKVVLQKTDGTSFPNLSSKDLTPYIKNQRMKIRVSHQGFLAITPQDLLEVKGKISFSNIDCLHLKPIDPFTFSSCIDKITHCRIVQVPKSLSKLLVYAKCNNCGLIEFYDEFEESYDEHTVNFVKQSKEKEETNVPRNADENLKLSYSHMDLSQDNFFSHNLSPAILDCVLSQFDSQEIWQWLVNKSPHLHDQAYMQEMANYLQEVQYYIRQGVH